MVRVNRSRSTVAGLVLCALMSQTACGVGFATQIRLILSASGPLIESLNLGAKKGAVIADFSELAGGAATLESDFKACGTDKPCKLAAVGKLEQVFEVVASRGNLGSNAKLQRVEAVARGVIEAAKIFYGGGGKGKRAGVVVTEADMKAKLDELKVAMQP